MWYKIAADLVLVVHLLLIVFIVLGGLLVLKWRRVCLLHLPAAAWGVLVEYNNWLCPLTPLEQWLRAAGSRVGYTGGFVDYYIYPLIYPPGFSRELQLLLAGLVLVINLAVYAWVMFRLNRRAGGGRGN